MACFNVTEYSWEETHTQLAPVSWYKSMPAHPYVTWTVSNEDKVSVGGTAPWSSCEQQKK